MIKIYLDPGHGGVDPGAVDHGLREKNITLEVSKKIRTYLNKHYKGFTVRMSRTTDKTMSLAQRVNDANSWGADYFLSVHVNAGGGTGYEDFIYNGNVSNKTISNRSTLHNAITGMLAGIRNRGKKRANFYVLRNTSMPASLTENMFIDTKADADKLKSNSFLNDIAKGHAEGLASALKLKKKGKTSKAKPKSKPNKPATKPTSNKGFKWLGTDLKGRRVESIYRGSDGLNYYDGPRWTNPSGTFAYGHGWKIDNKYMVDGSPMYRVQNSKGQLFWITASSKYVKVI